MGCLNDQDFEHWFGNIHFSGPCNRKCYFCIGQHMMALDPLNNLGRMPDNIDKFIEDCQLRGITEVNLTGTNTEPLLHTHLREIVELLRNAGMTKIGIRTNGALAEQNAKLLDMFDDISVSLTTTNHFLYRLTMGCGMPPDYDWLIKRYGAKVRFNVVLCPETRTADTYLTVRQLAGAGASSINLREPYGQPHVGLCERFYEFASGENLFGMPTMLVGPHQTKVVYWDVHYVEVSSVNLYANGHISTDYAVSKGHCPKTGKVKPQQQFKGGRIRQQWVKAS